jgi:hypothetical protein
MRWFRFYADAVDDDKLRLIAFEDRWHFVALCCLKSSGLLDAESDNKERRIAVKLGVQLRELDEIKRRLMDVELVDDNFHPVAWEKRQYQHDSSAERTRKYRERLRKSDCDGHRDVTVTGSDTDTDTDTERDKAKKRKRFCPPTVDEVKARIAEMGYLHCDAERFISFYQSKGWKIGRAAMKDWQAALAGWESRAKSESQNNKTKEVFF